MAIGDLKYALVFVYLGYLMWVVWGVIDFFGLGGRGEPVPTIVVTPPG